VFRRLTEYLRRQGRELSEFLPRLELTREQVLELPTTNFTHFEDVLDCKGTRSSYGRGRRSSSS
jgi:hypothetical protein